MKAIHVVLGCAVLGAAGLATLQFSGNSHDRGTTEEQPPRGGGPATGATSPGSGGELPPGHPPLGGGAEGDLPPGHPSIGTAPGSTVGTASGSRDPAGTPTKPPGALDWTVPKRWAEAANPSAMRLATYRIPPAKGSGEGAEVSVIQAGGSTEANIDRWVGQFGSDPKPTVTRTEKTVRSLKVTLVEIRGTFGGGGPMMGGGGAPKPGWMMLGAVVGVGPEDSLFFKATGPEAVVSAARPEMEELVSSLAPRKTNL